MAFAAKLVGVSRARIDPSTLSDLVVYADESGDHGLGTIDAGYPIFALAFIVMTRDEYVGTVTPALQRLKFAYWATIRSCSTSATSGRRLVPSRCWRTQPPTPTSWLTSRG